MAASAAAAAATRQLTLAVIKPDLFANPARVQAIMDVIQEHRFEIKHSAVVRWTRADAERFYAEHHGKFFFNRLTGYMSSGPMQPMVLEREDAIRYWRLLMGPTHPARARQNSPNTLRSIYGLSDTRNSLHGSDSKASALREIGFFFPDLPIDWPSTP
ncbi:nucleoside-diphosphate kinase [Capsaspora owczarzaki ATCC 30864]|uniref:Nucleoside diphosphate kinase n=1 Tax=Capsaspora owczarzaki (strain ATCC 30864) TaxID=595528 RepID=A0A0D2VPA3_CAPO3|nr:nucleoside-diphosphate kinase [Capsaspora owczarzaki ATCC 30864]